MMSFFPFDRKDGLKGIAEKSCGFKLHIQEYYVMECWPGLGIVVAGHMVQIFEPGWPKKCPYTQATLSGFVTGLKEREYKKIIGLKQYHN